MIGLAYMAMLKAGATEFDEPTAPQIWWSIWAPIPRDAAERRPHEYNYSAAYYRIIDRITRGEKP